MKRYPLFLIALLIGSAAIQFFWPSIMFVHREKLKFIQTDYTAWDRVLFDPVSLYER